MNLEQLGRLPVREVIALHRATLHELKRRGVVSSLNQPQGDYAETIVATAFRGEVAPPSEKSYDVTLEDGQRIQVKSRVVPTGKSIGALYSSAIRSYDFDSLVFVFYEDADLSIHRAVALPVDVVKANAKYRPHFNGSILFPTEEVLSAGVDVTERCRKAAEAL